MDAQEIRSLQEAYLSVYSQVISESECEDEDEDESEEEMPKMNGKKNGKKEKEEEEMKEGYDFFDVILEHLVAEGYADTNENALVIMANMSEEWKWSIVEEMLDEGKKEFPFKKVSKKAAGHEMDFIKRGSPESGRRARKMKAIASTVEVGGDPRKTMHGQDLRKM